MTQIVLIHGGESTVKKLQAIMPGAQVSRVLIPGKLSAGYDENTGIAKDYPTLRSFLAKYAPQWTPGEPLVLLGYSAGAWALRYYLRDAGARADISAAIFLDGLYGAPSGGSCNLGPYQGVIAYGKAANADPSAKRLIMTYSLSWPGPAECSKAIAQASGAGGGVFVRGYQNADHGAQQGVVGPAVVQELVAPWIRSGGGTGGGSSSWWPVALGAALVGVGWWILKGPSLLRANGLEVYLLPPGQVPGLGPERGRPVREGIAKFTNPYGSYRYVLYEGGEAIGVLQVVDFKNEAVIANLYVLAEARRRGVATKLAARARRDFPNISHSQHMSEEAQAWARTLR